MKAFAYSVEYQKRGMPHIHMLLTLDEEKLNLTPEFVDNIISAENVPKPADSDHSEAAAQANTLRGYVGEFQLHTCSDTYCLRDDGKCEKRFPREYSNETVISDTFPQYRRRHTDFGGANFVPETSRGHSNIYTNESVVPYNEFLLLKYKSHHNLEWVGSQQKALEYCLKYLLKGELSVKWYRDCLFIYTVQATTWHMCRCTTQMECLPVWWTTTRLPTHSKSGEYVEL